MRLAGDPPLDRLLLMLELLLFVLDCPVAPFAPSRFFLLGRYL